MNVEEEGFNSLIDGCSCVSGDGLFCSRYVDYGVTKLWGRTVILVLRGNESIPFGGRDSITRFSIV